MRYSPNTCHCIINITNDDSFDFISVVQRCHIHKDIKDEKMRDTIFTHNRVNNKKPGDAAAEKERIYQLDPARYSKRAGFD